MTKAKKIISWEKWKDPWNKEESKQDPTSELDYWEGDESDLDELDDTEMTSDLEEEGRIIITPMGAIPLLNHNSPGKIFNLWIGHTNFKISNKIMDVIANILGVESLDIYTPYRMRLGVGRLFQPKEVMHRIDLKLNQLLTKQKKV